jgi:hypothetical protein
MMRDLAAAARELDLAATCLSEALVNAPGSIDEARTSLYRAQDILRTALRAHDAGQAGGGEAVAFDEDVERQQAADALSRECYDAPPPSAHEADLWIDGWLARARYAHPTPRADAAHEVQHLSRGGAATQATGPAGGASSAPTPIYAPDAAPDAQAVRGFLLDVQHAAKWGQQEDVEPHYLREKLQELGERARSLPLPPAGKSLAEGQDGQDSAGGRVEEVARAMYDAYRGDRTHECVWDDLDAPAREGWMRAAALRGGGRDLPLHLRLAQPLRRQAQGPPLRGPRTPAHEQRPRRVGDGRPGRRQQERAAPEEAVTTRIPNLSHEQPEPAHGAAAGLCAGCAHGVVTVLRCGQQEAWQPGHLTSVAACHHPLTPLRHVQAAVERCDGFIARRT